MTTTKDELRELIEELSNIRGRHTELVTVMIPAGANIYTTADQIDAEKSTADNIKSKTVRKNVTDALEMISRELKHYKQTAENGIAIFCGNVSENEGQVDIKLWIIEPPTPLRTRMYRCDQTFVIEPLKEMLAIEEVYGLVAMDRREATLAVLEGKQVRIIRKLTSGVPGKYKTGGQCLDEDSLVQTRKGTKRIADVKIGEEIRALDIENNKIVFTKCTNKWNKTKQEYIEIILKDCWAVISSKDHLFFKENNGKIIEIKCEKLKIGDDLISYTDNELYTLEIKDLIKIKKQIELVDIETEQGNFFANGILVHNSAARFERIREGLAKEFYRRIAEAMKEVYFDMPKLKGIIIGGPMPTKEDFVKEGQLVTQLKEKIIGMRDIGYSDEHGIAMLVEASSDILAEQEIIKEKNLLESFFERLGKSNKAVYKKEDIQKAIKYGAIELLILSNKLPKAEISSLRKQAESISAKVEIVSDETDEGKQFLNLGGMGAILRYDI